jgi:DNA-binding NtrC family response regulator
MHNAFRPPKGELVPERDFPFGGQGAFFIREIGDISVEYIKSGDKKESSIPPTGVRGRSAAILIADDNVEIRETTAELLRREGHEVAIYDPVSPDPTVLAKPCDLAVLDMVMPNTDGFLLREEIAKHSPFAQFIIITAHPKRAMLDKAMDLGVFAFLTKPFTADQIRFAVMGALRMQALMRRDREHEVVAGTESMGLIGTSRMAAGVRRKISELAPLEIPVLITGESGTGKEVVARCVHEYSRRATGRFTAINCAGLSPGLIESELFGHAQGAFTGATKTKHGYFEVTDHGTLFLDEIGDLPLELQSRLLRVLDKGEYNRVGETDVRRTDVRVISATNRDLDNMVKEGKFRADLFYRLRGAHMTLAPLRERKEDIAPLVCHFLGEEPFAVAPDAMSALQSFDWPGNVRELKMTVAALKGMAQGKIITRECVERVLGKAVGSETGAQEQPLSYRHFKEQVLGSAEKDYFISLIECAHGNIAQAARYAGIDRKNFYEKMKQFGIA